MAIEQGSPAARSFKVFGLDRDRSISMHCELDAPNVELAVEWARRLTAGCASVEVWEQAICVHRSPIGPGSRGH